MRKLRKGLGVESTLAMRDDVDLVGLDPIKKTLDRASQRAGIIACRGVRTDGEACVQDASVIQGGKDAWRTRFIPSICLGGDTVCQYKRCGHFELDGDPVDRHAPKFSSANISLIDIDSEFVICAKFDLADGNDNCIIRPLIIRIQQTMTVTLSFPLKFKRLRLN